MNERDLMWQNLLSACVPGSVVLDGSDIVWQKTASASWVKPGDPEEYSPASIQWPVDVLLRGME